MELLPWPVVSHGHVYEEVMSMSISRKVITTTLVASALYAGVNAAMAESYRTVEAEVKAAASSKPVRARAKVKAKPVIRNVSDLSTGNVVRTNPGNAVPNQTGNIDRVNPGGAVKVQKDGPTAADLQTGNVTRTDAGHPVPHQTGNVDRVSPGSPVPNRTGAAERGLK